MSPRPRPRQLRCAATVVVGVLAGAAAVGCHKPEPTPEARETSMVSTAPTRESEATTAAARASSSSAASTSAAAEPRFSAESAILSMDLGGHKTKIADGVDEFWPVTIERRVDGSAQPERAVAYSRADGAGGYENEGESLYLFSPDDAQARQGRKVLAEYFQIRRVESLGARSGATVLLVVMADGGLGATHVAFVDPARGEVFRADGADVVEHDDGAVRVGWFRDEDWDALAQDASVRPTRTELFDLDALLKRPVMHNPRRP